MNWSAAAMVMGIAGALMGAAIGSEIVIRGVFGDGALGISVYLGFWGLAMFLVIARAMRK